MVLEEQLTQYGVFGLWTLSNLLLIKWFMVRMEKRETELTEVIRNNTEVNSRVLEHLRTRKC